MRRLRLLITLLGLIAAVWVGHAAQNATTGQLTLELVDARTNRPLAGIVTLLDGEQKPVSLAPLMNRGLGHDNVSSSHDC